MQKAKNILNLWGFHLKTAVVLAAAALCVFGLEVLNFPFYNINQMEAAEAYSRLLPIQIGSTAIPLFFCGMQAKPIQRLFIPSVIGRYTSRFSFLMFFIKRNLAFSALTVILLNLPAVAFLVVAKGGSVPALALLGCIFNQFVHLSVLCVLQQLLFLLFHNWYVPLLCTVLFAVTDFVFINISPEPFFVGWGLTLTPLSGGWLPAAILLAAMFFGLLILISLAFYKFDFLNDNRRTS